MRVSDVMTRVVGTCAPGSNLAEAAQKMWDLDCGVVPVVNPDGTVAGMITDRDICIATATRDKRPSEIRARDVISPMLFCCDAEDDVKDALAIMRAARVHRLPVVTPNGRLRGILSVDDVVLCCEAQGPGPAVGLSYGDAVETLKEICSYH